MTNPWSHFFGIRSHNASPMALIRLPVLSELGHLVQTIVSVQVIALAVPNCDCIALHFHGVLCYACHLAPLLLHLHCAYF